MSQLHGNLARRVARELAKGERCWIGPQLDGLRSLVADRLTSASDAGVVVLAAHELSEAGDVSGPSPWAARAEGHRPDARILAVLSGPSRIVRRCSAPIARVERVFVELGVLDVTAAGLVIVELAKGVSAVDLQAHAEPTLRISPRVGLMEG